MSLCDPKGAMALMEEGLKYDPKSEDLQQLLGMAKSQKNNSASTSDTAACRSQALNQEGALWPVNRN